MLLDRAYAREEVDSPSRPRSRVFPAQWRHEPRRKSPQEGGPTPAAAKRPGELRGLLDKPYFSVPRVQWDPFTGEFPLDIEAECSRARQLVSKEIGKSEDSLLLAKVLINTIYPHAAFMAQGLDPMTNRNHWVVSFQYCDVANLGTLQYEVLMLLDGSVLKARDQ